MQNNLGTILGGIALVVSLGNTYFLYDLSKGKSSESTSDYMADANVQNNMPLQQNASPMMDPSMQQPAPPPAPSGPPTTISFKKMEHNFGTIKQNSENTFEFVFTNSGSNPLVITDAQGSCGCTVPEFPKQPIPPGGSDKIKVVYKPGEQEGEQTKNVTITANTEPQQTIVTIKANVKK